MLTGSIGMVQQGELKMMILLLRKLLLQQRVPMHMVGTDEVLLGDYLGLGLHFVFYVQSMKFILLFDEANFDNTYVCLYLTSRSEYLL